jgi:hypothetical protein
VPVTVVLVEPEHDATHWLVATMQRGRFAEPSSPASCVTPKMAEGPPPLADEPEPSLAVEPQPAAKPTATTRLAIAQPGKT